MGEKLYLTCKPEKGGAIFAITEMLKHFHGVRIKPYKLGRKGTCLHHNILGETSLKTRSVVFVGGYKTTSHGIPRDFDWNKANHIVFQSNFFRRIALSKYKVKRHSVIQILGGAHGADDFMIPVESKSYALGDTINFIMVAKWWKRFYKRYGIHRDFFNDCILKEYPNSLMHVFGQKIENKTQKGKMIHYPKSFRGDQLKQAYMGSNIQLILTPFDSGPMTLNESMHYRVPFICGNNSCAAEFIDMVDGVCGEVVNIDPQMKSYKDCKKYKPMADKKFYNRPLDTILIMKAVRNIVENYPAYTSWKWTADFNYKSQSDKWMDVLFG